MNMRHRDAEKQRTTTNLIQPFTPHPAKPAAGALTDTISGMPRRVEENASGNSPIWQRHLWVRAAASEASPLPPEFLTTTNLELYVPEVRVFFIAGMSGAGQLLLRGRDPTVRFLQARGNYCKQLGRNTGSVTPDHPETSRAPTLRKWLERKDFSDMA
jgi:hypothetical protein